MGDASKGIPVIANSLVRKVVRTEYAMLRAPLVVVDRRLIARYLPDDSKVRVSLERGLHTLDVAAGRLLNEPAPKANRPKDESPRDESPRDESPKSDANEQQSASTHSHLEQVVPPADHADPQEPDVEEEREHIVEAILDEPAVGELADPELDVADVQAQLRAKHLLQEREEQERLKAEGRI
jgi:hypothetical protein